MYYSLGHRPGKRGDVSEGRDACQPPAPPALVQARAGPEVARHGHGTFRRASWGGALVNQGGAPRGLGSCPSLYAFAPSGPKPEGYLNRLFPASRFNWQITTEQADLPWAIFYRPFGFPNGCFVQNNAICHLAEAGVLFQYPSGLGLFGRLRSAELTAGRADRDDK